MILRRFGAGLAAAGLALTAACSTGSTQAADAGGQTSTTQADADAYPVTLDHAFGSTTITEEPTRVATLGWSDQDHAAALGVVPVGATKITWGGTDDGSSPWFDEKVAELGGESPVRYDDSDGAPVEEIAELAPELILATNSGITKKEYQRLSKIAPVVAYPDAPWVTPWQESLDMVGRALGRSSLADDLEAETTDLIEQAKQDHPELPGSSLIFGYLSPADLSTVGIYAPEDPRVAFMHDLGMVDAPAVEEAIEPGQFYGQVSAERASDLDSDVFLTWEENAGDMERFSSDELIGSIPAIESGHAYAEADKSVAYAVTNPNPLSIPVILEEFVPEVARAVQGS